MSHAFDDDTAPLGAAPADAQRSMVGLIGAIGDSRFADTALASLNGALRAASWSVYQVWPTEPAQAGRAPVLHLSAAHGVPDTTRDCFGAYRGGLYRRDRSFDAVRRSVESSSGSTVGSGEGGIGVLRMHADDAPNAEHRDAIYRRHGVRERLSAVQRDADGSLLAVNLYHHDHQGSFEPGELQRFHGIAAMLLAAVRRHIALVGDAAADRAPPALPARLASGLPHALPHDPAATARVRLQRHCPALTPRELDVCERLLRGWSFDGVAADLGLSITTVKTYRARAFERLGLHFRSELFARFGAGH